MPTATDRNFKRSFGATTLAAHPQHPPPATIPRLELFPRVQRGTAAPPARPGDRRSTALRSFGLCWTYASGWGRVAPQGTPEDGLGKGDVGRLGGKTGS